MAVRAVLILCLGVLMMARPGAAAPAEPSGHITGVGGVFFKAKDPKALAAWYRDVLGLPVEAWGGAALRYDAPGHPPALAWNASPASTSYYAPSTAAFMINYAVDDMDALLARLRAKGVAVSKRSDDANGRFAGILDPEGNKIELWEPKQPAPSDLPTGWLRSQRPGATGCASGALALSESGSAASPTRVGIPVALSSVLSARSQ
jgi:catechol 2,3-dioxygenase-like lactoylglutathione lyase family enzyme